MLGFLLPLGLVGLVALALPLLVHLARRSEAEVVEFAALRWLREAPKPRARVRFDEWLLLAVRLVMVALLALLLAQPVWRGWVDRRPVVAVLPGADDVEVRAFVRDGLRVERLGVDWASGLRELEAGLGEGVRLTVLAPGVLQGADAVRLRFSRAVDWRVVDGEMAAPGVVKAAPLRLAVRAAGGDARVRWFRAAVGALGGRVEVLGIAAGLPAAGAVVWLGAVDEGVLDFVRGGGVALVAADAAVGEVVWRDADGPVAAVERVGRGRLVRVVRPLTAAALPGLVEADFPLRLRGLLEGEGAAPARVRAEDYAPMGGGVRVADAGRDLRGWLGLVIGLLWAVERWLATRRARGAMP